MNSILLSAISLSGYCGFLLKPHTEGVEENARAWAAVAAVLPPHSFPPPHPHPYRAASGGGAPCVTAGDIRAKRGGTRGQADYSNPDAGGVALKAWRGNSGVQR